ncbi:MAG TPA: hypothetical protein VEH77_16570 [Roseiarcus sp.]|nr:hypothetical protein [Roseiarcus sp.]
MKTQSLLTTTALVAASLFAIASASAHSVSVGGSVGGYGAGVHVAVPTYGSSAAATHATMPAPAPMPAAPAYGSEQMVTRTGPVSITEGNGKVLGSTNYGGESRVVTQNPNLSHIITSTDSTGRTMVAPQPKLPQGTTIPDGKGGLVKYAPTKSDEMGSTVDGKVVVNKNGDVIRTDDNGNKTVTPKVNLPQGTTIPDGKGGLVKYTPTKSDEMGSTVDGKVVVKNGDVIRTDDNGNKTVTPKVNLPKGTTIPDGKGGLVKYTPTMSDEMGSTVDGKVVVNKNGDVIRIDDKGNKTVTPKAARAKSSASLYDPATDKTYTRYFGPGAGPDLVEDGNTLAKH